VVKVTEEFDLAECAQGEHRMVKGGYPFDGDFTLCGEVDR
jgi:hypothetical protein